ncbi:phage tail sheath C-terminal domain-containing protein [Arsenophonus nasoniae]|uniref:Phage tail sheath C-terminal domain-containing protein n=2 Tax=Arsenophonus nasoniae TaxID=638 RepID=A0AA95KF98_9GAMM|nr:phage tail sheath C-terminal domain-containing protein [Arsenophonus nasoniae]WGM04028.1 phage tail sheath C-terminal domain-containing protein [Arsenophonus nasoniae]
MSISFNQIPESTSVPLFYAEMDNSAANTTQDSAPTLIIGHALPDAKIALNTPVIMPSSSLAEEQAGAGSQLARMVQAYRKIDPVGELHVIATQEGAGNAASAKITISGEAKEGGMIYLYIGNQRISVPISKSDSANEIATALGSAITKQQNLPVNAGVTAEIITLTAKNKGATGNDIPLCLNYFTGEKTPHGLNVTIEKMRGGTGSPDVDSVLKSMSDSPFDFIGTPFFDVNFVKKMADAMQSRWDPSQQLFGHLFTGKKGSLSELIDLKKDFNFPHLSIAGYEKETQTSIDELVAMRLARCSVFLRSDPARPTQTGQLSGALPAPAGKRFTLTEQESLLSHGISTAKAENGSLLIQRDVTTYTKNNYGTKDNSYQDVETLYTSAMIVRKLKAIITSKYPRHKLANDGTKFGAGQAIVTPAVIRAELCAVYLQLENQGIVENFEEFKKHLIVERNKDNPNRLDVLFPPDYVNQLRIFTLINQFRLQYNEDNQ